MGCDFDAFPPNMNIPLDISLIVFKMRCCVEQSGCQISDQSSDLPLKLKIAPRTAPPDHIIFINAAL